MTNLHYITAKCPPPQCHFEIHTHVHKPRSTKCAAIAQPNSPLPTLARTREKPHNHENLPLLRSHDQEYPKTATTTTTTTQTFPTYLLQHSPEAQRPPAPYSASIRPQPAQPRSSTLSPRIPSPRPAHIHPRRHRQFQKPLLKQPSANTAGNASESPHQTSTRTPKPPRESNPHRAILRSPLHRFTRPNHANPALS
jgi:hypothetical protein